MHCELFHHHQASRPGERAKWSRLDEPLRPKSECDLPAGLAVVAVRRQLGSTKPALCMVAYEALDHESTAWSSVWYPSISAPETFSFMSSYTEETETTQGVASPSRPTLPTVFLTLRNRSWSERFSVCLQPFVRWMVSHRKCSNACVCRQFRRRRRSGRPGLVR